MNVKMSFDCAKAYPCQDLFHRTCTRLRQLACRSPTLPSLPSATRACTSWNTPQFMKPRKSALRSLLLHTKPGWHCKAAKSSSCIHQAHNHASERV